MATHGVFRADGVRLALGRVPPEGLVYRAVAPETQAGNNSLEIAYGSGTYQIIFSPVVPSLCCIMSKRHNSPSRAQCQVWVRGRGVMPSSIKSI